MAEWGQQSARASRSTGQPDMWHGMYATTQAQAINEHEPSDRQCWQRETQRQCPYPTQGCPGAEQLERYQVDLLERTWIELRLQRRLGEGRRIWNASTQILHPVFVKILIGGPADPKFHDTNHGTWQIAPPLFIQQCSNTFAAFEMFSPQYPCQLHCTLAEQLCMPAVPELPLCFLPILGSFHP